jgi:hypothetical protein
MSKVIRYTNEFKQDAEAQVVVGVYVVSELEGWLDG